MYSVLVYLRIRNLGHRDLKPSNIIYFLRDKIHYTFKLADFGVGKVFYYLDYIYFNK